MAADLAQAVQAERNYSFVHLGVGLFYALVTLVAAVLGVLGRDRGQFVFAALFAWLAIGEWQNISASLPAGLASGVWPPAVWDCVWNLLMHPGRGAAAASARARTALVPLDARHGRAVPAVHPAAADRHLGHLRCRLPPPHTSSFWVVGIAASWRVWRLGHRVGAVGAMVFALDAAVFGPYILASLVDHFVPIDTRPFEPSDWAIILELGCDSARLCRRHHPARVRATAQRAARARGTCCRRSRQRGQERLPGDDEPRDPHADERRHRHERRAARHAADRRSARGRNDDPRQRRGAADDHQRHPRLFEDRGRSHGHRGPPLRPARMCGIGARPDRRPCGREERPACLDGRCRCPCGDQRRLHAAATGLVEPVVERGEVHGEGQRHVDGCARRGPTN